MEEDAEDFEDQLRMEQEALKKQFEGEKAEIYKKKNILEEEKKKLIQGIEEKEREQALFKQNQQGLIKKLKKMEEKVLCGKEEEEAALAKADQLKTYLHEVEVKREKQRQMEDALQQKEKNIEQKEKEYKSLQEENDDKAIQIKQKMKRLKNLANENKELEEMYAKEIEALQERRRILQKELKLKNFIIDYFVPEKYIDMINEKVAWSEEHDDWVLPNLQISGNAVRHLSTEIPDSFDATGILSLIHI